MIKVCLLLLVCFFGVANANVFADESPNDLKATLEATMVDPESSTIHLTIILLNTSSHDITVLTKGLTYISANEDIQHRTHPEYFTCDIGYIVEARDGKGHLIVPSLAELAPVTLHPDQVAEVEYSLNEQIETKAVITSLKKGKPIRVNYRVIPLWGDCFNVWSGSVESDPTAVNKHPFGTDSKRADP